MLNRYIFVIITTFILCLAIMFSTNAQITASSSLLSDPFLQLPTENSVRVVWFTEFPGSENKVIYGENLDCASSAKTIKLSRMREDVQSKVIPNYQQTTKREIWRHEAEVTGLTPGKRIPYQVISIYQQQNDRKEIKSKVFTLTAKPQLGTPLKILLTSDHQLMPMVAANLQKVVETVGQVDAIFLAGDLVNVPDRASEWFDDSRGRAFFPCLQGRASYQLEKNGIITIYHGVELIQHAPLFTAIGNHEVMGRFSQEEQLNEQFEGSYPRFLAEKVYQKIAKQINPNSDPKIKSKWLKNYSFNTDTYQEIFTLPTDSPGRGKYYALTFGEIRLVVLYVTNMWRSPHLNPEVRGRYQERKQDLDRPENWGYGQHIFEPIAKGSTQYQWLEKELESQEFQQAKYKIVMLHHPPHTLGGNIVPPYTDPIPRLETSADGKIKAISYDYPPDKDYIIRDLLPLLESAGVQFVFYGHSHLWNRFVSPSGVHFLESSNVGNSYGAHLGENQRPIPENSPYASTGDPNGLDPVIPTLFPLLDENQQPLPYIASNDITTFSILDTATGTIISYRFDTRYPNSEVIKFDEFVLKDKDK